MDAGSKTGRAQLVFFFQRQGLVELVDPVAGVVLSDSLSTVEAVAESRMLNRRRGDSSFSSWWGRQVVALPFQCSRAAVLVALDGDASPTMADGRSFSLLLWAPPVGVRDVAP